MKIWQWPWESVIACAIWPQFSNNSMALPAGELGQRDGSRITYNLPKLGALFFHNIIRLFYLLKTMSRQCCLEAKISINLSSLPKRRREEAYLNYTSIKGGRCVLFHFRFLYFNINFEMLNYNIY